MTTPSLKEKLSQLNRPYLVCMYRLYVREWPFDHKDSDGQYGFCPSAVSYFNGLMNCELRTRFSTEEREVFFTRCNELFVHGELPKLMIQAALRFKPTLLRIKERHYRSRQMRIFSEKTIYRFLEPSSLSQHTQQAVING